MSPHSLILVAVVLCITVGTTSAWWCNGHMIVATVALRYVDPKTSNATSTLVDMLSQYYPQSPDLITSACWADDLKARNVSTSADWHYISQPLVNTGVTFQLAAPGPNNVVWAIENMRTILLAKNSSVLDKAMAVRYLIHFVGDIHQPLHTVTYFSTEFPTGDDGGNLFQVQGVNQTSLHMFYDSGAGLWEDPMDRPLAPASLNWLNAQVDDITSQYPKSGFSKELNEKDASVWAQEGYDVADRKVYADLHPNQVLNTTYINNARVLCRRAVALAGYRLAQELSTFVPK